MSHLIRLGRFTLLNTHRIESVKLFGFRTVKVVMVGSNPNCIKEHSETYENFPEAIQSMADIEASVNRLKIRKISEAISASEWRT